jgi:hypothetical protein
MNRPVRIPEDRELLDPQPSFLAVIHTVAAVDYRREPTHVPLAEEEVLKCFQTDTIFREMSITRSRKSLHSS